MLTWEGLKEQAKLLGLPLDKQRVIVREYTQTIILRAIYQTKYGQKIFFMGGTALRFAYGLKRFSEGLDFNTQKLTLSDFRSILKICQRVLEKEGFINEISLKERKSLLVGQVKLTDILQKYKITAVKDEKLMIKIKINRPSWKPMLTESAVMDRYGYLFSVLLYG